MTAFSAAVDQVTAQLRVSGDGVEQTRRAAQFARLRVGSADGFQLDLDLGVDWRQDDPVVLEVGPVFSPKFRNPLRYFLGPSRSLRLPERTLPWQDLARGFKEAGWIDLTHTRASLLIKDVRIASAVPTIPILSKIATPMSQDRSIGTILILRSALPMRPIAGCSMR